MVFPTETVYGLGADATNADACRAIYTTKGRPSDNPLIIHIACPEDAERYAVTSSLFRKLADTFMPGPITVIMPVRDTIPASVTAGLGTVAVRCPSDPVAHALIAAAGVPIAAPSANLSGSPSPTCGAHVLADMNGRVDAILIGGACEVGLESTIVKLESDDTVTLLRPGGITPEEIEATGVHVRIADAVLGALREGERVLSPGMKYKHYAPRAPLTLLDGTPEQRADYVHAHADAGTAVLCCEEEMPLYRGIIAPQLLLSTGARDQVAYYAHRLFALLRETDLRGAKKSYAALPGTSGLELALYNRMIRAAAHRIIPLRSGASTEKVENEKGR